jgi:hypothetical protein
MPHHFHPQHDFMGTAVPLFVSPPDRVRTVVTLTER